MYLQIQTAERSLQTAERISLPPREQSSNMFFEEEEVQF